MAPKVAIVFYSTYGHLKLIAEAEKEGLKKAGIEADVFQVAETLFEEILSKMKAGPKSNYPIITGDVLETYDTFLFGIPTRFGTFPGQWKAFWDSTGKQWSTGGLWEKYAGLFVGTATQGSGQETTTISAMSTLAHHGIIYVPLGYKTTFAIQSGLTEIRGGSPWGAGTYTPSAQKLELALLQGESFGQAINKVSFL